MVEVRWSAILAKLTIPGIRASITGGSSGGSAAAVTAGLAYAAIGTDTAGSIREPAALCGCVGLKATYGRVSNRGVIPLSPSLDHVGPLARSVADAAIVLQVIAGFDAADITCADVPVVDYVSGMKEGPQRLRVGIPREYFFDDLDPEVASATKHALDGIQTMVAQVRDVQLEVPTDRTLQAAESYAYHAESVAKNPGLYQAETLRRIRSGENVSATEYIERRRELKEARRTIRRVFADVDVVVTPTTPMSAPAIAELQSGSGCASSGGTEVVAEYAAVQCLGIARHFSSLRIYAEWITHRAADCGAALAGGSCAALGFAYEQAYGLA